ncbi:MAG: EamA family transporter [Candidatus Micrarchaeota archaeon]
MEINPGAIIRDALHSSFHKAKGKIYIFLSAICLGSIGMLVKLIGASDIHYMTLNFYRIFFGFIFLLIIVPSLDKQTFKITKKDAKDFLLVGMLLAISLSLYTTANLFTSIQSAVLIHYSYPFFVLIFAYLILKEQVTRTKIITLVIAIIGLAILNPLDLGANNFGNILALIGAIFFAALVTEMRKEDKTHGIGDVVWFFFFASLLLLPAPFIFGFGDLSNVFIYVLVLGVISTGLAYFLYNIALETIEAEMASIISMITTPLVAISLAVLIIGETLSPKIMIGGSLLILSGIYLQTYLYTQKYINRLIIFLSNHTHINNGEAFGAVEKLKNGIKNSTSRLRRRHIPLRVRRNRTYFK